MIRILAPLLLAIVLLPAAASAQTANPFDPGPMGPPFRKQVAELDKTATPVGYALQVRREGAVWIAGGGLVVGATLITAAVDLLASGGSAGRASPYIAGLGVPLGLSIILQGLPQMLGANHYLHYLVDNGVPRTHLGRLRLMHDWRVDLLRKRRDTTLVGSAFLGAITVLSGVVWAVRDARGVNGSGANYDSADAFTTLSFWGASGVAGLSGLFSHLALQREIVTPHRLYARVSASGGPVVSRDGVGAQASLTVRF